MNTTMYPLIEGTPVRYAKGFIANDQEVFTKLWEELAWERRAGTPRREYYANDLAVPYAYGKGDGRRTYEAREWHPEMRRMQERLETELGVKFEVCFLNGYEDQSDFLGWHADDSPEMDDERPIVIVSLGAARQIWFKRQEEKDTSTKLLLDSGSICLMEPQMQTTHFHRIPKSDRICGQRISLTFRGYKGL